MSPDQARANHPSRTGSPAASMAKLVQDQARRLETLLGLAPETIPSYVGNALVTGPGVILTPDQVDQVLAMGTVLALLPDATCQHRCREGRHCGGCGCPGCGYTPDLPPRPAP